MKTIINNDILTAIKRKRGELNISVNELARQTGVSRWTLDNHFKRRMNFIHPSTKEKLVTWLAKNS